MIDYTIHNNILELKDLNIESNMSSLTPQDVKKIETIRVLQVKEKANFQRDMISVFRNFLDFCMKEHKVYLVLHEAYPQMKNRIRSKKGLFYKHKDEFEKSVIFETETEVSPDDTLFTGIIRITEKNIDYIVNNFDNLAFTFGLITPPRKKTFIKSRKDFLEAIVLEGLNPGKIYWKNWLKIAAILAKPGRKFFSLQDLNDTEYLRIFYNITDAEWGHKLESFISQELQTNPIVQN